VAFPHYPGVHCSSTSIASLLAFDGYRASEAMVFGLGGGLGFVEVEDPRYSPVHRFNGRALDLEGTFYRRFGHELQWHGQWNPQAIEASLAAGRPLIAQTDIAYLPYYEPVHFPMHGIVVVAFDGQVASVADTFAPELMTIPAESLRAALEGKDCPLMDEPFRIASAPRIDFRIEPPLIAQAIAACCHEMLEPGTLDTGIPAMHRFASHARAWRDSGDWAWSARFAYQSIEKRGTGGGGFRGLYADFLEQVAPALPWIGELDAVARMRHVADDWTNLAQGCKAAFVEDDRDRLLEAGQLLDRIAESEAVLLGDLGAAAAKAPRFGR
jgi:hypothetical protein